MKKILYILSLAAAVAMTSCDHKELCFDHPHNRVYVQVVFDWRNAPDAAPESMSLYLFPKDGGKTLRYDFAGRDGGVTQIPVGNYDVVCVNSDTETVQLRGLDHLPTMEITTFGASLMSGLGVRSDTVPRAPGTENERMIMAPEMLWVGRTFDILIEKPEIPQTRPSADDQMIIVYPEEATCHYSLEIHNATNLMYVTSLSGALSGMSGGLLAETMTMKDNRVTMPFPASTDWRVITADWYTFGHCPELDSDADVDVEAGDDSDGSADSGTRHKLTIYTILNSGSGYYYTYDVTDQIHAAEDPHHVHIVLDGLPIPKPTLDGGFRPDVNEWETEHIDIPM